MLVPLYALFELGILLIVILPTRVVVDGLTWRFGRSAGGTDNAVADKPPAPFDQPGKTAQTEGTIPRKGNTEQSSPNEVDGEEGDGS